MHVCLNVDEIVRLIACELVESKEKATAVALACCRKDFEDPVLDTLWETQEKLLPLLRCLPGDVWNGDGCTSFRRLPTAAEWVHFRKYTQRMRTLNVWLDMKVLPSNLFSVLQLCAVNDASKRFLPNLRSLSLWPAIPELIPFIPSLLSPRITTIDITFKTSDLPKAMVTSMIVTFSILCPNLEFICLEPLPRDPTITAAVSGMLLTSNRNTLRRFHVDSPLTEEAREVIYKLPDLCELSVVIEKDTPLPLVALPNLTELRVTYDHDSDCLHTFHGATFGKLESIHFRPGSEQVGDFLEAFKRVALAASVHKTLLELFLNTSCSWNPNYSSLLPFTQLATLVIGFSCKYGCSSRVDDDIVTDIARAMPRLEKLHLGEPPCRVPTGVTATGLAVLAHHCPDLSSLCIHFQATTLNTQPAVAGIVSYIGTTSLRRNYALMELEVGHISVSKESVPMIALTLFRIFPSLGYIPDDIGGNWEKVIDTIQQIADRSGATSEDGQHDDTQTQFDVISS